MSGSNGNPGRLPGSLPLVAERSGKASLNPLPEPARDPTFRIAFAARLFAFAMLMALWKHGNAKAIVVQLQVHLESVDPELQSLRRAFPGSSF